MFSDILTVMWKERKGLLRQRGSRTRAVLSLLVPIAMVAIYLPFSIGTDWLETPWSLTAALIPMLMVGMTIPESFAGERERHTLESLLASRLPDRAILFGKVAVAVGYGWVMALFALLLSLLTVNIAHWNGQFMFYTPPIILADLALSLLMSGFMAGLGVLISLRSATVQGATQALIASTLFPLILLGFIPPLILNLKPEWADVAGRVLAAADFGQIILIVLAALIVVDIVLLAAAMSRFQRAKLILS